MGKLVQNATETLATVTRNCVLIVLMAEVVEDLLNNLLEEISDKVGFYLFTSSSKSTVKVHIYADSLKEDRAFLHRLRRALRVSGMERRFLDSLGIFEWRGESEVSFNGHPIEVTIAAANNGCAIRRVEEVVTRVRFEADCGPRDSVLAEEEPA